MTMYGYARISKKTQSIERQIRNIKSYNENAIILSEAFTGRKVEGRKEFNKLLSNVKSGDTIIFDSVSRMSRDAEEGFKLYKELLNKDIELIFLNEPHINTTTYKTALGSKIQKTGNEIADKYIQTTNEVIELIAEQQIKIAFDQAQKEVTDLSIRTSQGIETARLNGKQIGGVKGVKLTTKKSIHAKKDIMKYSKDFNGTLKDTEVMKLVGLARNTYYKYKKELIQELQYRENNANE